MTRLVNITGHIVPSEQALVSAYDHGFLYGDGVYETLRTYGGVPFLLEGHLKRLRRSADMIRISWADLPVDPAEELRRALVAAGNSESLVRLALTRGSGPFGYDRTRCQKPNFLVYVEPFEPPSPQLYEEGATARIVSVRRNPTSALDPHIKSMNLLNNILAAMEAFEHGADEAFMLNLLGNVAESCSANIFIVRDGKVLTPPLSAGILDGLTRAHLLDLCRQEGIPAEETDFRGEDIHSAEECFVTSTTREVMPIARVDGRAVGQGKPGPSSLRLLDLFRASTSPADGGHASD